ncbi:peptidyl-tRNA hydrolase [Orientia chuto str. Dubai]|uniref:Peptidyl-tRNA hydrolase n=1 Tax=Orientia chuto str. Dubai TaxID=1359168 RepID=A0A0F3MI64_9RICK|nr:aminoacyl-tRNA hydrolase [Candidatus Orientia mediorientalis]KJV55450.1 peptidyl-tRNA hydrolase [Orientia chuto str. Dubai]
MLIVGLGNPGREYANSRHNAGYIILDQIAFHNNFIFNKSTKYRSEIIKISLLGQKIILIKPLTYMNLSGIAVLLVKDFYKLQNHDIIVIHDDIDLPLGSVKLKVGGSSGGHNGLKSISNAIGESYLRIKIGIGRPISDHLSVAGYVLSDFPATELTILYPIAKKIAKNFELLVQKQLSKFMLKIKN